MFLSWPRDRTPVKALTCKLKELREQQFITQAELAKYVNVSRRTIIAVENNQYYPSLLLAFKLADYFKVKIEELFILAFEEKYIDELEEFEKIALEQLKKIHPEIDWEDNAKHRLRF